MRKLLTRACMALVFAGLLPLTVAATPVLAVGTDDCNIGVGQTYMVGSYMTKLNFSTVRGVRATLHSKDKLNPCTPVGLPVNTSTSAWIAIQPAPGTPHYGSPSAILQVGMIKCTINIYSQCDGHSRYFWARGGCNNNYPTPIFFGGPNDWVGPSWQNFSLSRLHTSQWHIAYSDDEGAGFTTIDTSNTAINCWINDEVQLYVIGEMKNAGDTIGEPASKFYVRDIKFRASVEGTWYIPGQKNSAGTQLGIPMICKIEDTLPGADDLECDDPGTVGDKLDFWTTH